MPNSERRFSVGEPVVQIQKNRQYPPRQTVEAVYLPVTVDGQPLHFSVSLGSITEAPAEAILCPSNPWFGLAMGAVENAIRKDAGSEPFDAADKYMAQKEIDIPGFTREDGVPYGAARAFPSGKLAAHGIKHIIFSNVLPNHERLSEEMVARCIGYALLEADRVQAKSLAVPAIGTGFIGAMQGFSMVESFAGTVKGLERYHAFRQDVGRERIAEKLSLVIYAQANYDNAVQVSDLIRDVVKRIDTLK